MTIPRDDMFDASLALLREGYGFIRSRCGRFGSDAFRARLMLTPVVCMRGHRCLGEWLTIAPTVATVRQLCRECRYVVPMQNLTVRQDRMPVLPESGLRLQDADLREPG